MDWRWKFTRCARDVLHTWFFQIVWYRSCDSKKKVHMHNFFIRYHSSSTILYPSRKNCTFSYDVVSEGKLCSNFCESWNYYFNVFRRCHISKFYFMFLSDFMKVFSNFLLTFVQIFDIFNANNIFLNFFRILQIFISFTPNFFLISPVFFLISFKLFSHFLMVLLNLLKFFIIFLKYLASMTQIWFQILTLKNYFIFLYFR